MHPLDGAYLRVKRADKHITDLERRAARRNQAHQKNISYQWQVIIQRLRFDHKGGRPLSLGFGVVVGEVIYNLRAALDYLIYELALRNSGQVQDRTQFPIESTASGFDGRRKTNLKGISDPHIAAIEMLQPYKGCNWTALLRDLSNPDKHRRLTESRAMTDGSLILEFGQLHNWIGRPGKIYAAQGHRRGKVYDVYVYVNASVVIEFSDGLPVIQTLKELHTSVANTLGTFKPKFK